MFVLVNTYTRTWEWVRSIRIIFSIRLKSKRDGEKMEQVVDVEC